MIGVVLGIDGTLGIDGVTGNEGILKILGTSADDGVEGTDVAPRDGVTRPNEGPLGILKVEVNEVAPKNERIDFGVLGTLTGIDETV